MLTTVVGSYPVIKNDSTSVGSLISKIFGLNDPFTFAIKCAVKDQINAGIDVISDGQVRGDMIEIFANNIPGMTVDKGVPKIIGKIRQPNKSIGAQDLELALKTAKYVSNDFKNISEDNNSKLFLDQSFNENFKGIKGIITGPTTLVLSSRVEGFYQRDKKEKIIGDMAVVLKNEAHHLQNAGATMIQIDEPFLSTGIADLGIARKAIKTVVEDLDVPVSMHVCGEIGEILTKILNFPVHIIDCEFAGRSSNLDSLKQEYTGSKKIGFGCIDTKTKQLETLDHVRDLIKTGIEIVGEKNMIIDPDCGMKMLSRDVALFKLKKMKEAVEWLS
jgi:5-methyltetrahydropteroyltriglutamate--homocysteine methyltransferase